MSNKIRFGMVGGGQGAFIGAVHRLAANLDGRLELVCGAFSSTPEKSRASGADLGIDPARCYGDFEQMMQAEAALPSDQRMQFVVIVTPNHMHFPVAKAALLAGFHVLSDKPVTRTLEEAKMLQTLSQQTGLRFGLTHNYSGYPMIKQARDLVASGALGAVRKVIVEYIQGWLSEQPDDDNKQAAWRLDPALAGPAGAMGDIGTHAAHLAEYVTGDEITRVNPTLNHIVEGRLVDDDAIVQFETKAGARGVLQACQIATGEENNLTLRIYGTKAGLEWRQMEPNSLVVKHADLSQTVHRTAAPHVGPASAAGARLPAGHPEGFIEAFANIYRAFADAVAAPDAPCADFDFPGIDEAVHSMAMIEAIVQGAHSQTKWHTVSE